MDLNLSANQLSDFRFLTGREQLRTLYLRSNQLTDLELPEGLTGLTTLNLGVNRLSDFSFLAGRSALQDLDLSANALTRLVLPPGLSGLKRLDAAYNLLSDLELPPGLDNLVEVRLAGNPLRTLTLPAGNPKLWTVLGQLRDTGVQLHLLPLLKGVKASPTGVFAFDVYADAGSFKVWRSTDSRTWAEVGAITIEEANQPGRTFTDSEAGNGKHAIYVIK
jgi:Leucine-rich repeat (LRR) protein